MPKVVKEFGRFSDYSIQGETQEQCNRRVKPVLNYLDGRKGHPDLLLNTDDEVI